MKKLFFLLLLFISQTSCSQFKPENTLKLSGKGKFGGTSDQISVRRFNDSVTTYYAYDALFKKVYDVGTGTGVTVRDDSTKSTDGKISSAHIVLRNDSIVILHRPSYNQSLSKIFGKKNIFLPYYLKVVVDRNKLQVWGTKRTDGKQLSKLFEKDSVFLGWKHRTPNLLFPVFRNITTAEIASVKYTSLGNPSIPGIPVIPPPDTIVPPDTTTIPPPYFSVTEPAKAPYFFSDGHPASYYDDKSHHPAIFTSSTNYDAVNEIVWIENDTIKVGINLKAGGHITYISKVESSENLVNNGYDKGRQFQIDPYQNPLVYTQGGETAGALDPYAPTSYNTTMGGDYTQKTMSLVDYHPVPKGYYIKIRPLLWPMTGKLSEIFIEATYTLTGNAVKIDYVYTSFRTDGQYDPGALNGAAVPAMFVLAKLNKYKYYAGGSPFTNGSLTQGTLPIQNNGEGLLMVNPTEYWTMIYNDAAPNHGIGLYNPNGMDFQLKQLEVYSGDAPYTEFSTGFSYMNSFEPFSGITPTSYTKNMTCYVLVGSETQIRSKVYALH